MEGLGCVLNVKIEKPSDPCGEARSFGPRFNNLSVGVARILIFRRGPELIGIDVRGGVPFFFAGIVAQRDRRWPQGRVALTQAEIASDADDKRPNAACVEGDVLDRATATDITATIATATG